MDWIPAVDSSWLWVALALATVIVASVAVLVVRHLSRSGDQAYRLNPTRSVTPVDYCHQIHRTLSYAYHNPNDRDAAQELTFSLDAAVADAHTSETELVALVADFVAQRRRVRTLSLAIADSAFWPLLGDALDSSDVMVQLQAISIISRLNVELHSDSLGLKIQHLTKARDLELARSALTLEIKLDPASGLNLAFNRLNHDGLWAIERVRSLLDAGGYPEWRRRFGPRRVSQVTSLLTNAARSGSPAFRMATVEVLERIPERAARAALGRLAHIRHPGTKRPVTGV